jgi:hypothetical protein
MLNRLSCCAHHAVTLLLLFKISDRAQYGPARMSLVLLGGQPLEQLESWVRQAFDPVPIGIAGPPPAFSNAGMPFEVGGQCLYICCIEGCTHVVCAGWCSSLLQQGQLAATMQVFCVTPVLLQMLNARL